MTNPTTESSTRTPTVLIVDDAFENLSLMQGILKDIYKVKVAASGQRALDIASTGQLLDLILLDIEMPLIDGYEVIKKLKADPKTAAIPVVFISAKGSMNDEKLGLELGAVDYIGKPISPPILLARVKTHISSKLAADFLRDKNAYLEEEVQRRTQEVGDIQDVTIMAMASLAEIRDSESANHLRRTQSYIRALGWILSKSPKFSELITPKYIGLLYKAAPLHDIGKVGIPDRILLNPGKLTPEEFEVMKTHTTLGGDALASAETGMKLSLPFFALAREIAYSHHEKWDGSGYPQGLAGEAIPVSARLMALADVYDALVTRQIHKKALSHEQALDVIRSARGKHFDPDVVDALMDTHETFKAISIAFSDDESELAVKQRYYDLATASD